MRFKKSVSSLFCLFLLGSGLLSFFVILSGARHSGVLKNFYWLEADTSGFNSAPDRTKWFNYNWCGSQDGVLANCSNNRAAMPFSPRDNFGSSTQLPGAFMDDANTYYYLSRVGWAMLLIGLTYIVCAIIPMFMSIFTLAFGCTLFTVLATWLAWFFITLAACLYTGCYVKARNVFHDNGRVARLGVKNFAFIWTSVALLTMCAIWSTVLVSVSRKLAKRNQGFGYDSADSANTYGMEKSTLDTHGANEASKPKKFFFWRRTVSPQAVHDVDLEPELVDPTYNNQRSQPISQPLPTVNEEVVHTTNYSSNTVPNNNTRS
ncbi:LAFE_0H03224g1_1 [Lachancea fermentati]|uniref:LAFE_0H03224g1_1 n=1 Tax=Lachancea fermentati TaxID=4955 RepID=A0A1G4MJC8_LACFM|nr:LAFE_0H03224g1_1 [Lachancea fermentati]